LEKCSELVWAAPDALPDDVIADFRFIIEHGYVAKESYLESGY
jgi:hypothetical protein